MKQTINEQSEKRRGFLSMELALTLPILLIVLLGLLEFSLLFTARGTVAEASRAGARAATLQGVTQQQIEEDVYKVLGAKYQNDAQVGMEAAENSGETVTVAVRIPMSNVAPDLLWPIGYSLKGRFLYAETSMVKE